MANSRQSKKRARQQAARNQRNAPYRSMVRTYIKNVQKFVAAGNKEESKQALVKAHEYIDKAKTKGLLHVNKAARLKSRLNTIVKNLNT